MKNDTAMVIMAKQPCIGSTKTRLCPPLTPEQAAALYEALLLDTIELGADLDGIDLAIAVTPADSTAYFEGISPHGTLLLPVECPDIGDCLTQVLGRLLELRYAKVLALNSDGPSLPPEYIHQAASHLDDHDLVLGPGEDGGYYLVGLKELHRGIFKGIDWSTPRVLEQTLASARELGISTALNPTWYDIDTITEVDRLRLELDHLHPDRLSHTRSFFDGG